MKNRNLFIILGAFILLLFIGGVLFFVFSSKSKPPAESQTAVNQQMTIGKLSAEDIGLKLVPSSDNKKVKVVVDNTTDIKSLEYEITYESDVPPSEQVEGGEGRVGRGFNDEAKIASGQHTYESKYFDLGSCSKNVCRYDTGVDKIDILMKVTKQDGKIYQVNSSVKL